MSYHHLNTFEHTHIEVLSNMGYSTIDRKLKRNTQETYQAASADELT